MHEKGNFVLHFCILNHFMEGFIFIAPQMYAFICNVFRRNSLKTCAVKRKTKKPPSQVKPHVNRVFCTRTTFTSEMFTFWSRREIFIVYIKVYHVITNISDRDCIIVNCLHWNIKTPSEGRRKKLKSARPWKLRNSNEKCSQ